MSRSLRSLQTIKSRCVCCVVGGGRGGADEGDELRPEELYSYFVEFLTNFEIANKYGGKLVLYKLSFLNAMKTNRFYISTTNFMQKQTSVRLKRFPYEKNQITRFTMQFLYDIKCYTNLPRFTCLTSWCFPVCVYNCRQ